MGRAIGRASKCQCVLFVSRAITSCDQSYFYIWGLRFKSGESSTTYLVSRIVDGEKYAQP